MPFGSFANKGKSAWGNINDVIEGAKKFGQMENNGKRRWVMPGFNFLGPNNPVEEQIAQGIKPTNDTDAAALNHDLDYSDIWAKHKAGKLDKNEFNKQVRDSDTRFINHLDNNGEDNLWGNRIGRHLIKAKNIAEDLGIIDHNYFLKD
jgi:hypothetical protein